MLDFRGISHFRFKRFDADRFLITNDIGCYSFLQNQEFSDFITGRPASLPEEKQEELRRKLFILSDGFKEQYTTDFLKKNFFLNQGPTLHIIIVTNKCNHACRYCHAHAAHESADSKDMSIETATRAVDTIFYSPSNTLRIEFQGGEPLLNFDVVRHIVTYAKRKALHLKKDLTFALVSNLSLMTDDIMHYLIDEGVNIDTSLDGDELTHNFNRVYKGGNAFKKVTYWIDRINNEYRRRGYPMKVGALATITSMTLPRYKELIDTYVSLGLDSVFLRPLNPFGFAAKNLDQIGYEPYAFIDFYKKSIEYILQLNRNGIQLKDNYTSIFLQKIMNDFGPNFGDERSPCGASIGQVAYNYDGKIYTCDEGRMFGEIGDDSFLIGRLQESGQESYSQMILSRTTRTLVSSSILDALPGYDQSVYKPYLGICPIYNYKKNGDVFPNFSLDSRLKITYNILDFIFSKITDAETRSIFRNWVGSNALNRNCI